MFIQLNTVNGRTNAQYTIYQVPVPHEFGYYSNFFIKAYGMNLVDKDYSLLLGMDIVQNI